MDHVPIDREVVIYTDSKYSINCLTDWFHKWETNGWKSSSGKTVDNKDLIEPIIARIREREICKAKTRFTWVKGHANDPGNVAADALAVQGSFDSTPGSRDVLSTSHVWQEKREPEAENGLPMPTQGVQSNMQKQDASLKSPSQHISPTNVIQEDKDAAVFEGIFADLAAEQSTGVDNMDPASTSFEIPRK